MADMKTFLIFALIANATTASPTLAPPLTKDQTARLRCVAALAIVANEQQRGIGEWNSLPPLQRRGAHFAGVVGESLTGEGGRTREAVRAAILAEVSAFQTGNATAIPTAVVGNCLKMMDALDPAPPPPGLTQCAALIGIVAQDARARTGLSDSVKTLMTFASVLDSRAREALRVAGKTEAESDIIIGLAKEDITAQVKLASANPNAVADESIGVDIPACLERAKP